MTAIGYVTEQELIDYAQARGIVVSVEDAPIMLTRALDYLQVQDFKGHPCEDNTGGLHFPIRCGEPVPEGIKTAQKVCALLYLNGYDPLAVDEPQVTQETVVGAVSVSYNPNGRSKPKFGYLDSLLEPFLDKSKGGANQFTVSAG